MLEKSKNLVLKTCTKQSLGTSEERQNHFDGSHHHWFEERGAKCCLITLIDDTTNKRLSMFFDEEDYIRRDAGFVGLDKAARLDGTLFIVLAREGAFGKKVVGLKL